MRKGWTNHISTNRNSSLRRACYIPTVDLVRNDWCFVHNYVHKAEHISPTFQIQKSRSMSMHNATFGQNINGDSLLTRHDLSVEFNNDVDFSLFFLWEVTTSVTCSADRL